MEAPPAAALWVYRGKGGGRCRRCAEYGAPNQLRAFVVDVDGVEYYVAAKSGWEALNLVRTTDLWDDEYVDGISVELVSKAVAGRLKVHDDGTSKVETFWVAVRSATEPQVIACSEWP